MFKGLGNLTQLVKQAQEMRGRVEEVQNELGQLRVHGSAGGGMVQVEANGQQKLVGFQIDPSLIEQGDQEMLEDLLLAACNQALEKSREAAAEKMSAITGGLELPGLNDMLSKFGLGESDLPTPPST